MLNENTLALLEAGYKPEPQKEKVSGLRRYAANALPIIGGAAGNVLGAVAGKSATSARLGGAAGSGLGEFLRQKILGEETNVGNIARESLFGAIPGGGRVLKNAKGAQGAAQAAAEAEQAAQLATQQARTSALGSNVLSLGSAQNARATNLGTNVLALGQNKARDQIASQADEATRFNELAAQNIQKLSKDSSTQGLPLPGGGILVRPGATPSFASEGVERMPVPTIPEKVPLTKFKTPFVGKKAQAPAEVPQTTEAVMQANKPLTQRVAQRLTENGSGLKAGNNSGDLAKLEEQAQFMSKYQGTPRQQRAAMEQDMTSLSTQVDDILRQSTAPVNGSAVLKNIDSALADSTKYPDLNLAKISDKTMMDFRSKFGAARSPLEVNERVKEVNKLASKAQGKLGDPKASPLTQEETAALLFKRAGDNALSEIPEIKPLKQNMAQIFEVTPQVARAGEKSIGAPMLTGFSTKAPVQAFKGAQSYLGAKLQGSAGEQAATTGAPSFRPFMGTARAAVPQAGYRAGSAVAFGTPFVNFNRPGEEAAVPEMPESLTPSAAQLPSPESAPVPQSNSIFTDAARLEQAYTAAIMNGDTETANALLKGYELFGQQAAKPIKKTEGQRARDEAAALTDDAIAQLEAGSVKTGLINAPLEDFKSIFNAADPETLDFNTTVDALKAAIAKARAGTSFTANEEKLLNKYAPKSGDSMQRLTTKLQNLKVLYRQAAEREYGTEYAEPASII